MTLGMFGSSLTPFNPIDPRYLTGPADGSIMPQPTGPIPGVPRAPDAVAKTSFFGDGGPGRAIAGNIGDTLLQLARMQPIYGPAMQAQREFEQRRQLAQMEGQRTLNNELALYNYKVAHPDPNDMSEFDKGAIAGGYVPGSPEWVALHKQHVQEIADPVITTPTGMMLRSQAIAQMGGQPAPAGVTFTPLDGGPTPRASANFPHIERYYNGQ